MKHVLCRLILLCTRSVHRCRFPRPPLSLHDKRMGNNGLASFIWSRGLDVPNDLVSFQRTGIVTIHPVTRSAGDRAESLRTVLTTMVEDRRLSMPWFTPHSNKHHCQISQTGRTIRLKLSSKSRDECHGCPERTAAV